MKTIFRSSALARPPIVSFILLDWSCRESFHSLNYLAEQTASRDSFEIIWIENYDRISPDLMTRLQAARDAGKPAPLDQWFVMGMPRDTYYHKHLMYNIGLAAARGDIIVICDSDAMFSPAFVQTLIDTFNSQQNLVLHFDEVRSKSRGFYPFNYPSFQQVMASDLINWNGRTTTGIADLIDPLHSLNYGACMCARRDDLLAVGGADEHFDYLGHVCGPYEATFRLQNFGRTERWHPSEFLLHTWHPGESGDMNYVGPHDGRLLSTTALHIKNTGRVRPLVANRAIEAMARDSTLTFEDVYETLIDPAYPEIFRTSRVAESSSHSIWATPRPIGTYDGYNLVALNDVIWACPQPIGSFNFNDPIYATHPLILKARTEAEIKAAIDDRPRPFTRKPKLVEVYRDHNLIQYVKDIIAIPFSAGQVLLHEIQDIKKPGLIFARTVTEAKDRIDEKMGKPVAAQPKTGPLPASEQPGNLACSSNALVVGAPRSGFTLLIHIINALFGIDTHTEKYSGRSGRAILGMENFVSTYLTRRYKQTFARFGITSDLIFNGEFQRVIGGPKWLDKASPDRACFRKYFGVRGMGDFLLVTAHPRQVLEGDLVIHSHVSPPLWLKEPYYDAIPKFTSVRNPIGIINSACFSLNAMASEYIQKFMRNESEDFIRQRMGLYKLTDLEVVRGLTKFMRDYLDEYLTVSDRYFVMKWEDLIQNPAETILAVAGQLGIVCSRAQAEAIWKPMDHVNLLEHHKHNYRRGKGIVGDWKNSLVNEHMDLFREYDLGHYLKELGYPPIPTLSTAEYSPYQKMIERYIRRGEVYRNTGDQDLFGFAFNKSNIDASKFGFKSFPKRVWTHVERSTFTRDDIVEAVSDTAEDACAKVNELYAAVMEAESSAEVSNGALWKSIGQRGLSMMAEVGDPQGLAHWEQIARLAGVQQ